MITVFGPSYMDHISYVDRIVLDGSVSALRSESFPGGTGLCYAQALKRLGADVTLCTALGDDEDGERLKDHLKETGIESVIQVHGKTDHARLFITPPGDKFVVSYRDASNSYSLGSNEKDAIDGTDVVAVTSFHNKQAMDILSYSRDKFSVFSPNLSNCRELTADLLDDLDYLNMSRAEYDEAVQRVPPGAMHNGRVMTVTDNGNGARLYHSMGYEDFACFPETVHQVVNSKGAGESFCSAFLHYFIQKDDAVEAMRHGLASGYLKVQRTGIDYPSAYEVERAARR